MSILIKSHLNCVMAVTSTRNTWCYQNRIERATDIIDSIKKLKKDSDGKGAKELDSEVFLMIVVS